MTLLSELRAALARFLPESHKKPLCLVALSGGADSVALAYALHLLAKEGELCVCAVHVHHGIRKEEADRDAAFCHSICDAWQIPLTVSYVDVPAHVKQTGQSEEEGARELRYAQLDATAVAVGADCILTAHHQDDQAETVLLRVLRGTSVDGLGAMATQNGRYLRPFLRLTRNDILDFCQAHDLSYVEDSTNADTAHPRNFLRHRVLPLLQEQNPLVADALCRLAQSAREDASYWKDAVQALQKTNPDCKTLSQCHDALLKRYLCACAYQNGAKNVTSAQLQALVALVKSGKTGQSVSLAPALQCRRSYQALIWERDERTPTTPAWTSLPLQEGRTDLPNGDAVFFLKSRKELEELQNIYKSITSVAISSATIQGQLICRPRKEGDAVRQNDMTRSYKKLSQSRHLDARMRAKLPLICDEKDVLWIPSLALCDRVKPKKGEEPDAFFAYLEASFCS